jgi:epoxyqueuosine reductase
MKNITSLIKDKAVEIGFEKIGVAKAMKTAKEKRYLNSWIKNGSHASMKWIEKRKDERSDINVYFPEAKSVISVGLNYYVGKKQTNLKSDFKFSNYAWGEDYHHILKEKLFKLLKWIKKLEPGIKGLVCVDTAPIMEKVWAQRAGLGWIGKHTNLITPDHGSWLFLGELILDIDLKPDLMFDEDLCGSCTACLDACPTNALTEYQIESEKCISYKTIEYRGDFSNENEDLNGWIYGCDICQDVCPWNNKFSKKSNLKEFLPKKEIVDWSTDDWKNLNEENFRRIFKGSSVKRTKYIGMRRNIDQNKKK